MSYRALAFIIEGKPGIPIQLERLGPTFDQTVVTNGDGYALFATVPESPWDVNLHIHAAGYQPYDYVLSAAIGGPVPPGNHNLFVGMPSSPIHPPFDILLPPLVSLAMPRVVAGRWDFFTSAGRYLVVGSTELMLAWRYDVEGPDAIRAVMAQRRDCGFNNLRVLWQKGPGSNGLTSPWQMPIGKLAPFLSFCAEYQMYVEGVILADCQTVNPSTGDQHARVAAVRDATAGITNNIEQLGNEWEKNGFDPKQFVKPTDRLAANASSVEGGEDAPYWDFFCFSGRRTPVQAAIREYGPVEFLYGTPIWGGLPAICDEGFKPGQQSSDARDFERAGAQARSCNGGRFHSDAGTAGNSRLFNGVEASCARAFVKGMIG